MNKVFLRYFYSNEMNHYSIDRQNPCEFEKSEPQVFRFKFTFDQSWIFNILPGFGFELLDFFNISMNAMW